MKRYTEIHFKNLLVPNVNSVFKVRSMELVDSFNSAYYLKIIKIIIS